MKTLIIALLFSSVCLAERMPMTMATDSRMKIVSFDANQVYPITAHYGYFTHIELAPYEVVQPGSIIFGVEGAYDAIPTKNHIVIKPLLEGQQTNLMFFSNLRAYYFTINAHKARSRKPRDMTYRLKFNYPIDKRELAKRNAKIADEQASQHVNNNGVNLKNCESFNIENANFDYTVEGDLELAPQIIFDDGTFTYIKMDKQFGAIKSVDEALNETMVNYHQECGYVVVESVQKRLTIRKSGVVTCLRNQAYIKPKSFVKQVSANVY